LVLKRSAFITRTANWVCSEALWFLLRRSYFMDFARNSNLAGQV